MAKAGDLYWQLFLETRDFVSSTKLTKAEFREMRRLSAELEGEMGKASLKFDKFAKLMRNGGPYAKRMAMGFAELANTTARVRQGAVEYIRQLRLQADALEAAAAAGKKLNVDEQARLKTNRMVASQLGKELALTRQQRNERAQYLRTIHKQRIAERAQRIEREQAQKQREKAQQAQKRRGREFFEQFNAQRKAQEGVTRAVTANMSAQRKNIARQRELRAQLKAGDITARQHTLAVRNLRQELTRLRAAQDKAANGAKRQAKADREAAEAKRLANKQARLGREFYEQFNAQRKAQEAVTKAVTANMSAQRKNVARQRELREQVREGTITQREYTLAIRNLRQELTRLRAAQDKVKNGTRAQTSAWSAMSKQVLALGKQIGFISAGYTAVHAVSNIFKQALELQQRELEFEIFTGSREEAQRLVGELRTVAAETPLTLDVSTQTVRTLLQYGVASREVIEVLKQLGDVSGADTEKMQRLALAYGQVTGQTRLMGQELRQLTESGFNPLMEMERTTGEQMLDLRKRMKDGEVSIKEVAEAFRTATEWGGRFADRMERTVSETAIGKLQRLSGVIDKYAVDVVSTQIPLFEAVADGMMRHIKDLEDAAKGWQRYWESAVEGTGGMSEWQELVQAGFDIAFGREGKQAQALAEAAAAISKVKDEMRGVAEDEINRIENQMEINRLGADEVTNRKLVRELAREGLIEEAKILRMAYLRLQTQEETLESIKEAGDEARRNEEARKGRRDQILARHEDPGVALRRQLGELFRMECAGMFANAPGVVNQERKRLTQEFIDGQVEELKESQQEAASASTAGSREEFQIMRQISMSQVQREDRAEEQRHAAAQRAREAVRDAIADIPADLAELFPVPVGS